MARRRPIAIAALALLSAVVGAVGCDAEGDLPREHTVASASPAATDIVLRLGARDRLVAVSRYDAAPEVADLPRVGDANGIDWEVVAQERPSAIAIGIEPSRLPAGDRERAASSGVDLLDVRVVRLGDVSGAIRTLAAAVGNDPDEAVRTFESGLTPGDSRAGDAIRVLVLLDDDLSFVAGRRNYVDDLIARAGGENAVPADLADWPTIDREALLSLKPDAVVLLLPGASERSLARAEQAWRDLPAGEMPPWEAVVVGTEPYVMTPGWTGIEALAGHLREALEVR